jgi:hypothetical protein
VNTDQLNGILRIAVPAICAWLASKGVAWFGLPEVQTQIVTIVVAIVALVWSWFTHSNAAKLKKVAALDPGVQVTVPQSLIASDPGIARVVDDPAVPNVDIIDIKR